MKKTGFSLAEALVSMLILSIFFVVTSKVVTTRQPDEWSGFAHGYYECLIENGNYTQRRVTQAGIVPGNADADKCTYEMQGGNINRISKYFYVNGNIRVVTENLPDEYGYNEQELINEFDLTDETQKIACDNFLSALDSNSILKTHFNNTCPTNTIALYINW